MKEWKIQRFCLWALIPFFMCTGSCVSSKGVDASLAPVYAGVRGIYRLLPPENIESPMDMVQRISGVYGKQELVMEAWVKADETQILITLLSSFGNTLGELVFRGQDILFSSDFFPPSVKPEYIAADFQFCFYRADVLEKALAGAGLAFTVDRRIDKDGEHLETRTIIEDGGEIITIEKKAAMVRYTNHLRGYTYTLEGDF
jgi:hypothetical protein